MEFANKVVLITGGTSGIGETAALAFARGGAKVAITGRREAEGQRVVSEIVKHGGTAIFIKSDISVENDVKRAVEQTVTTFGGLDIAFNNAGVEHLGPIVEFNEADYRKVFDTNVLGVLLSMKYQVAAMLKRGGGSIVNTSSVAGHNGMAGVAVYVASKHAVEGITKSAALELAESKIRVNAVAPAAIETAMVDRFAGPSGSEQRAQLSAMHPIGRLGRPQEVADAVLFLASDRAQFVTGISLPVDGGWLAK